jgi:DNA polymerase-3 subunit gamma/tau
MSYEVLARRWRPQSFDDVAGQAHVVTALRNALRANRMPHALLLAGPRGVGKTTLARILARSLNCDSGPTEQPCGRCSPCTEIAAGRSLDVQEIDAASNTGVDNVREIRESVRFAAGAGKHRIFIIDEVHMLSTAAFNALLKTLEEPPPHSLFVLATTDPQKIPATVLSRVQRFDLKLLGSAEVLARLGEIAEQEKLEIPQTVLRAIAREGAGSLRDALTLLDRLIGGIGPKIGEAEANAVLDLIDRRVLAGILDPVLAHDPAKALIAVRAALAAGADPARLAADLLAALRDLLVARLVDDPAELLDATPEEVGAIQERARPHSPETLQQLFRLLLVRNQDLPTAPRPDHVLEMAIARLASLPEAEDIGRLIARLDALEGGGPDPRAGGPGGGGGGTGRAPAAPTRPQAPAPPSASASAVPPAPAAELRRRAPEVEAQLRSRAKEHPSVKQAIDVLDAQLREIRVPRGAEAPGE